MTHKTPAVAFDAAKVESLRSAIASGTYKIDTSAIAGKLVDLERMLAQQESMTGLATARHQQREH